MVQPIGNQLSSLGLGLAPAAIEQQKTVQNAATEVTATEKNNFTETNTKNSNTRPEQFTEFNKTTLEKTIESLNENLKAWSTGMKFEIDDELERVVVSIVDTKSGDVLRKVPSDAVLKVAKMIVQMQGSGIDTQA